MQTTSQRLSDVWWMVSEVSEARRSCEDMTDLWAETARPQRSNRAKCIGFVSKSEDTGTAAQQGRR